MIWVFFWGVITGVGISFVGALFWIALYKAISEGFIQQVGSQTEEK